MAVNRKNYYQTAERIREKEDRAAAMGEYSTGSSSLDFLMKELNDARPKMEDFSDVYEELEIERDKQEIEKIRKDPKFEQERSEKATAVEAIIACGIAYRGWLGDDARITMASEYDDLVRGTDMQVSLPHPKSSFGDGRRLKIDIDVTLFDDEDVFNKKIARSHQRLNASGNSFGNPSGWMTELKYIKDQETGQPENEPNNHYVLSLGGDRIEGLIKILTSGGDKSKDADKDSKEFTVQYQIAATLRREALMEIGSLLENNCAGRLPLDAYLLAKQKSHDDPEAIRDWAEQHLDWIADHFREN